MFTNVGNPDLIKKDPCLNCTLPFSECNVGERCHFVQIQRAKPKPPSHVKRDAEADQRRAIRLEQKRVREAEIAAKEKAKRLDRQRIAKNARKRARYAANKRSEQRIRKTQQQRKYRTRDGIKDCILAVLLELSGVTDPLGKGLDKC